MIEVVLGVQPVPQPSPHRNPEGDCFACAMTAALRHLYPDKPIGFGDAWQLFWDERTGTPKNVWFGIRDALWKARELGYELELTADLVEPQWNVERWSHAWWQQVPDQRYAQRLEGWLRGGWVAFTEINLDGGGPYTADGLLRATDHILLLDGIRSGWQPSPNGMGQGIRHEVHVVCSARGAYWIDLWKFLTGHGAAGWWLARRDQR